MVNELLVNVVNSVLGTGTRTARGNQAYHCPFCNHHKPKLEINFTENKEGNNLWQCWVCVKKGKKIYSLFKHLDTPPDILSQLKPLIKSGNWIENNIPLNIVVLPEEYKNFDGSIISKHALVYLKKRNITRRDIIKYNIGYCEYGQYAKMIIIPSYDTNGKLNYFTARSFEKEPYVKYRNPEVSRDIIPFELFINWDLPIILCEGPFDAMAIKRNAIPLFGKNVSKKLMQKLVTNDVKKVYIALDKDAIKNTLKLSEEIMNSGKEVYIVELEDKDPSEMGFENFTKLIQKSIPLTFSSFFSLKLSQA